MTLRVEEGEVFGFLGPNGAGKTTIVRMLCCLIRIRGTAVGTGTAINPCEKDGRRRTKVNRSSLPIEFGAVGNRVVMSAIRALNGRDRELWFELFSEKPEFSDDGVRRDLVKWCEEELFGSSLAYLISIDKVEDGGLTFYAKYHSDRWGDFKTFWRFQLEDGKISRLDVGATDY